MANTIRRLKRRMGAVLLKLHGRDLGLTEDEWAVAKMLASKRLARFVGPEPAPGVMKIEDVHAPMTLAANSCYELTDAGEAIVASHNTEALAEGRFLLPGEAAWYDRWPWRLLIPAAISVVVTVVTTLLMGYLKGQPPK